MCNSHSKGSWHTNEHSSRPLHPSLFAWKAHLWFIDQSWWLWYLTYAENELESLKWVKNKRMKQNDELSLLVRNTGIHTSNFDWLINQKHRAMGQSHCVKTARATSASRTSQKFAIGLKGKQHNTALSSTSSETPTFICMHFAGNNCPKQLYGSWRKRCGDSTTIAW